MASTWAFEAQGPGSIPGGGAIAVPPLATGGGAIAVPPLATGGGAIAVPPLATGGGAKRLHLN